MCRCLVEFFVELHFTFRSARKHSCSRSTAFTTPPTRRFPLRFWVNSRHYKLRPGTLVIIIDSGETNGEDRLPLLETGIADILARATGEVGVVLEHSRFPGQGHPNFRERISAQAKASTRHSRGQLLVGRGSTNEVVSVGNAFGYHVSSFYRLACEFENGRQRKLQHFPMDPQFLCRHSVCILFLRPFTRSL